MVKKEGILIKEEVREDEKSEENVEKWLKFEWGELLI